MKEYINLTLPVSLIILSDYTIESKIIGLECLHHIISNVVSNIFVFYLRMYRIIHQIILCIYFVLI